MQDYTEPNCYLSGTHFTAESKIMKYDWLIVSLDLKSNILVTEKWFSFKPHVTTEVVTDFSVPKEEWDDYLKMLENSLEIIK